MCGHRPVGRPGGGRVDLDEPGGTALAYQPVLAEVDSGNRDFHSSRTLLGSISSGHALISRSRWSTCSRSSSSWRRSRVASVNGRPAIEMRFRRTTSHMG
jgi:hypothetical protein